MQLSSRMFARLAAAPLAFAVAGAAGAATASASTGPSKVVGHVYVNDNTAGANTVAGFDRHADGALTAMPGSPYTAGGAGSGGFLPSQGALQLSSNGKFVLAVDAASDQVSVLRVHGGGALTEVATAPVSSGGGDPVSVAEHDGLVYVANAGPTGTNVSGFRLTRLGNLKPIVGSTVAIPGADQPGQVLFSPDGTHLIVPLVASSQIASFAVDANGLLTEPSGSPYTAQGVGPFGSVFSPTSPNQLFVTNAHNAPGDSTVSTFIDGADGALTPLTNDPVPNGQSGTCWSAITPDGATLFTVNTGSSTITSYSVAGNGGLDVTGTVAVRGASGLADLAVSPDGANVYVVENGTDAIGEFDIVDGQLRELASDPIALPAGATPAGIAVS